MPAASWSARSATTWKPEATACSPRWGEWPGCRSRTPDRPHEGRRAMSDDLEERITRREVKRAVKEAIDELLGLGEVRLAGRFEGGSVVLRPGKADTQEKTIPLAAFFHKIT